MHDSLLVFTITAIYPIQKLLYILQKHITLIILEIRNFAHKTQRKIHTKSFTNTVFSLPARIDDRQPHDHAYNNTVNSPETQNKCNLAKFKTHFYNKHLCLFPCINKDYLPALNQMGGGEVNLYSYM